MLENLKFNTAQAFRKFYGVKFVDADYLLGIAQAAEMFKGQRSSKVKIQQFIKLPNSHLINYIIVA